jgi:hypothetical protein
MHVFWGIQLLGSVLYQVSVTHQLPTSFQERQSQEQRVYPRAEVHTSICEAVIKVDHGWDCKYKKDLILADLAQRHCASPNGERRALNY